MPKLLWALAVFLCLAFPLLSQDVNTKLADAARTRDTAAVRKLLAQGADPNTKDGMGRTPLMEAASQGDTDAVRVLLENGADVNAADLAGWTALFWAASFGYSETVRALLEKGASANAKDSEGWTALMIAAHLGNIETVRTLLEKNADVHVRSKVGITAQSLAEKGKYHEIVALLQSGSRTPLNQSPNDASGGATARKAGNSVGAIVPAPGTKNSNSPSVPSSPLITPAPSKSEILNQKLLQAAEAGDTAEVFSLIREGAGSTPVG